MGAKILAATVAWLPACALVPEHADAPRMRQRGPVPSRVQHPIKLGTLAFRPRSTDTQPVGQGRLAVDSAYSNMFQNGTGPAGESVVLDGELWVNSVRLRCGLSERTDVELELGILHAADGFLDRLIESWHAAFGFPNGGHEDRPRFAYEMRVAKGGQEIYELDGYEPGLLDAPLVLTQRIVDEDGDSPALAWRVGVDLPLGSEASGLGNGGWDWGAGLLAQKSAGRWTFTGAVDWVDAKRPGSFAGSGVDVYDGLDVQLGAEYRWNDGLSLLAGLVLTPPVTRDFTIRELDREMLGLDLALAWDTGESSCFQLGFEEDLFASSGPDFTLLAGWTTGW